MSCPRLHRPNGLCLMLLAAMHLGCGSDPTAVQLVLTPDPTISPLATMLAQLDHLSTIADGKEGLSGVSEPGALPGGGTALDYDGDKVLEVEFAGAQVRGDTLPVLEIGLENNADRDIDFRVLGYGAATAGSGREVSLAEGGVSARVPRGQLRRVGAPFNLTSRARPPRVLLVVPSDLVKVTVTLGSIIAEVSTTVTQQSLAGHIQVLDPKRKPLTLAKIKLDTTVVVAGAFSREERSLITIDLPAALSEVGHYEIRIGPGIESTTGHRFDQNPSTAAEDGFVSRFDYGPTVGGGSPCDYCPSGYKCHATLPACVPAVSCSTGCASGFVCDPATQHCLEDCRVLGLCFNTSQACDAKTGLCH